jgi:hypothetical protein
MKVLLIGGAPNTGKSNAVAICANYLLNRNFTVLDCQNYSGKQISIPKIATGSNVSKDFLARLEGLDKNNKRVSAIITSASDTNGIIDANFNYFQNSSCDIYISSIRDIDSERSYLLQKFGFRIGSNELIEFPLAKMSRKNANWYTAKAWYDATVQNMLEHILNSKPFEV